MQRTKTLSASEMSVYCKNIFSLNPSTKYSTVQEQYNYIIDYQQCLKLDADKKAYVTASENLVKMENYEKKAEVSLGSQTVPEATTKPVVASTPGKAPSVTADGCSVEENIYTDHGLVKYAPGYAIEKNVFISDYKLLIDSCMDQSFIDYIDMKKSLNAGEESLGRSARNVAFKWGEESNVYYPYRKLLGTRRLRVKCQNLALTPSPSTNKIRSFSYENYDNNGRQKEDIITCTYGMPQGYMSIVDRFCKVVAINGAQDFYVDGDIITNRYGIGGGSDYLDALNPAAAKARKDGIESATSQYNLSCQENDQIFEVRRDFLYRCEDKGNGGGRFVGIGAAEVSEVIDMTADSKIPRLGENWRIEAPYEKLIKTLPTCKEKGIDLNDKNFYSKQTSVSGQFSSSASSKNLSFDVVHFQALKKIRLMGTGDSPDFKALVTLENDGTYRGLGMDFPRGCHEILPLKVEIKILSTSELSYTSILQEDSCGLKKGEQFHANLKK